MFGGLLWKTKKLNDYNKVPYSEKEAYSEQTYTVIDKV